MLLATLAKKYVLCLYIRKKRGACSVTRSTCRGSGIAQFVETSNAEAPRQCKYIEYLLDNERQSRPKPLRTVYNTPHEAFCIALFLTNCVVNCQIPTRQNQSVQKRLLSYVCLPNLCPFGLPVWV